MAKVLLIEDDEILSRMYKKLLTYNGHDVETAHDAKTGLDKAESFSPDIIFLDVILPDMNGLEVLEKLQKSKKTKDMAIILLTNLGLKEELEKALKNGASRYIIKNENDSGEILTVMREVLTEKNIRV